MTTGWKKLTTRDLTTFDDFATDAVLTAMQLGGTGRIQTNGHAKIRGANGIITISRDSSAPHCRGNIMSDLKRAFPDLKTGDSSKKDTTVTPAIFSPQNASVQGMLECPAKGCDETFSTLGEANAHVHAEHFICKWVHPVTGKPCDMGPDGGPFIGKSRQSIAGHTNIRHLENKPWEKNREQAAANRAATVAARKQKLKDATSVIGLVDVHGHPAVVTPTPVVDTEGNYTGPLPTMTIHPTVSSMDAQAVANGNDPDATAKLALIREILGDDTEVVALKKEVADLKAHLALVREAVGLDFGDDDNK